MRRWSIFNSTVAVVSLAMLYLPMLAVAVFSVNQAKRGVVWQGFTLSWYTSLLDNKVILQAALNTAILALVSTAISTVLGTMLALGMGRFPWKKSVAAWFDLTVYLPVVSPDIIFAAAMVVIFRLLRTLLEFSSPAISGFFDPGMPTMIIAHVTFQMAFVALVVRGRLATIGPQIEEAARDLYASNFYILRKVMLPLLAPGIFGGAVLAFTMSLDDFVISFFTSGPDSSTLPIFIYSSMRRGISAELHAVSTIIFLATVVLVMGSQLLAAGGEKKKA